MKLDLSTFSTKELETMLDERKKELASLTLNANLAELVEEIEEIEFFLKKDTTAKEDSDGEA
jgi:ribosomal protein L29